MEVDQAKAKAAGLTSEFRGQTYYFCANEDKVKFDKEPTRYAGTSGKEPATPAGKRLSAAQWEGRNPRTSPGRPRESNWPRRTSASQHTAARCSPVERVAGSLA